MSYYGVIAGKFIDQVANIGGWAGFCDWVDTLPVDEFADLIQLREHGLTDELKPLGDQLRACLKVKPAPSKNNVLVIERLLDILAKAKKKNDLLEVTDQA